MYMNQELIEVTAQLKYLEGRDFGNYLLGSERKREVETLLYKICEELEILPTIDNLIIGKELIKKTKLSREKLLIREAQLRGLVA